jgi:hypothetical protein
MLGAKAHSHAEPRVKNTQDYGVLRILSTRSIVLRSIPDCTPDTRIKPRSTPVLRLYTPYSCFRG